MSVLFRFDDSTTERSGAAALAKLVFTQASLAASEKESRGDVSANLVGIGSAGAPSQNPMQIAGLLPGYTQPGVSNPPAVRPTPAPHLNAMAVAASGNYQQSGVITPAARVGTVSSAKNPMGL